MKLSEPEKHVLYIFGVLNELESAEMLSPGEYALSSGIGVHEFDNLMSDGFVPDMVIITKYIVELNLFETSELYYFIKIFEEVIEHGLFETKEKFEKWKEEYEGG